MKKNINCHTLLKVFAVLLFALSFAPAKAIEGRLVVSTFSNFFDRWYKSGTQEPMQHLSHTPSIYKRQVFYMLPVITGFSTQNGKANVLYNLSIKQNGKIIFSQKNLTGLKKYVVDSTGIFLCETIQNFEFTKKQANGNYTIEAQVIDYIAHDTALLQAEIKVSEYSFNERRFKAADSFFVWQNYYYEGIDKDREIDGLMFFSFPQMQTNAESTLSLLAYFSELFKGKTYLQQALENIFADRNENERITIIHLLHLVDYMPQSLQNKFNANEKKYYADLKGYGLPTIPAEGIQNQVLLNMQWAKFFATGDYQFAKNIANVLDLVKYEGSLANFNQSQQTEKDKQAAFLETVYQKIKEQMQTRLPNHPLLNGYCLYMLQKNEVSDLVKKELETVVIR